MRYPSYNWENKSFLHNYLLSKTTGGISLSKITVGTENGAPIQLYFEDVGEGKPIVLIHGWPLSGRSWEAQVPALVEAGYRVITYDRRGFGESSKVWDGYEYNTFAADLNILINYLDLHDVTLVGFSMGGGEVARYIGQYGTSRLSSAVLAGAVTPYLFKDDEHPEGGMEDADVIGMQDGVREDRIAFLEEFSKNFYAAGDKQDLVSDAFRHYSVEIASFASPKGTIDCIAAFGRTDFREDLKKFDIPTLVIHGDADNIVPFEVSGKLAHEQIKNAELQLIANAPHGLTATHADEFNEVLLQFLNKL